MLVGECQPAFLGGFDGLDGVGAGFGKRCGLRRIGIERAVAELSVQRLEFLVKLRDQRLGLLDLLPERGRLGALVGGGLPPLEAGVRPGRLPGGRARSFEHQPPIILDVVVVGRHRAVRDQPEPVSRGLDQVTVVADEDHGAGKRGECVDQCFAAVDVEVVGRLVEDEEMGAVEGGETEQEARLLAAGEVAGGCVHLAPGEAHRAGSRPDLRLGGVGHQRADVVVG